MDSQMVHVRMPSAVLARLDAEAKRRGMNRTALIIERCEGEGGAPVAVSAAPKVAPMVKAAPAAAPIQARTPAPKGEPGKLDAAKLALANAEERSAHLARTKAGVEGKGYSVQVGPVAPPPGSRLKGAGRRPGEQVR